VLISQCFKAFLFPLFMDNFKVEFTNFSF